MKNLHAGGYLFVGGAILATANGFGQVVSIFGMLCILTGVGMLLYYVFSKNGNY